MIAIANALDGMDRASAARLAGMDRQTFRDWVRRYNTERNRWALRPAQARSDGELEGGLCWLAVIREWKKIGRWRVVDLCRYVEGRWDVSYSETGMLRLLRLLDLSHRKT